MDVQLLGCACGLDPATETMAAQAGIALVISAPIWFRAQIFAVVRRIRRREADPCADEVGDSERR